MNEEFAPGAMELPAAYCKALMFEAGRNEKIVAVDAGAQCSTGTRPFYDAFPARGINCGKMEAHAAGLCAGMSAAGLVPFFHIDGAAAVGRAFEPILYACDGANVKIVGGGGLEDVGMLRAASGVTIIEPADAAMLPAAVKHMAKTPGVFYLRLRKSEAPRVYNENARFFIGKANELAEGHDVGVVACGRMVHEALLARDILAEHGIMAAVLDMHTIKPLDEEAVVRTAQACGAVVTAEHHSAMNGLGSAVAGTLAEHCPVPMERVGAGMAAGDIASKALVCIKAKKSQRL